MRMRDIRFERKREAQLADLQERARGVGVVAVVRLEIGRAIAREIVALLRSARLRRARAAQRQREHDEQVRGAFGDVERRGQIVVGGEIERRAVGQHAARAAQAELAELEQRVADLDRGEAPARAQTGGARFELRLKVTVVLLQMLRLQKHPFRPDDLAVPVHSSFDFFVRGGCARRAWVCASARVGARGRQAHRLQRVELGLIRAAERLAEDLLEVVARVAQRGLPGRDELFQSRA